MLMPLLAGRKKRTEGACAPCRQKKRKCDQLRPKCSQCIKKNDTCETHIFRSCSGQGSTRTRRSRAQVQLKLELDVDSTRERSRINIAHAHTVQYDSTEVLSVQNLTSNGRVPASTPSYPHYDNDPEETQHQPITSALESDDDANMQTSSLVVGSASTGTNPSGSLTFWPTSVANSHSERFLWDFFLKFSQENFICFDLNDTIRFPTFQNPFVSLLPRMALSSNSLRTAVFCFSAMQYTLCTDHDGSVLPFEIFYSKAIHCLVSEVVDTQTILPIIATGLFLSFCDQDRNQNFLEIARSAAAYLAELVDNGHYPLSTEYQVIMSLLRWTDISTLCSLQTLGIFINEEIHQRIELRQHELTHNYCSDFNGWISHPIFAFSKYLVNPLLRLGRLIQRSDIKASRADEAVSGLEEEISQLEEDILNAVDIFQTSKITGITDIEPLLYLNTAMHTAALLLFYSRLRKMPFTAALIRRYVQEIVNNSFYISVDSITSNALLFPLGVAGCEAVELASRDFILERIRHHKGVQNPKGLITSLQQIWAIRDAEPGLLWPEWRDKVDPRNRAFTLF